GPPRLRILMCRTTRFACDGSDGEMGRREGLKIPWNIIPCRFESGSEHYDVTIAALPAHSEHKEGKRIIDSLPLFVHMRLTSALERNLVRQRQLRGARLPRRCLGRLDFGGRLFRGVGSIGLRVRSGGLYRPHDSVAIS